jgi:hypothetical protein
MARPSQRFVFGERQVCILPLTQNGPWSDNPSRAAKQNSFPRE